MNSAATSIGERRLERILFLIIAAVCMSASWAFHGEHIHDFYWKAWDGLGYYQWLPSVFVTGKMDWMFWCEKVSDDKAISLYSLGVAVLELPFFLLSELFTRMMGIEDTGFSTPNAVAMMASTATYSGLGAVLSFRLAKRYGPGQAALIAVITLFACTNLFHYAAMEPLMSHAYSFFLIALFCWCSLRVIDGPSRWHIVGMLFSGSLIVLVRQMNVIVFLFPLWMALTSPAGIKGAWHNVRKHPWSLVIGSCASLIPWMLQVLYWHYITGHWYANGYSYKNEHFEFDRMVPGMVLFSPNNGWFVYSPIFLFVVAWLIVHAWRNTSTARPVLVILAGTLLIYSAWWCWWLGGAFGYRGTVDLYGLLAIPLAWSIHSVLQRGLAVRIVVLLLLILLSTLNFGMMEHHLFDAYDPDPTWPKVWDMAGAILLGK